MEMAAKWQELHKREERPVHRGTAAVLDEALSMLPLDEGSSRDDARRHLRAIGLLTSELRREPTSTEIHERVADLKQEDIQKNHEAIARKQQEREWGTDSGWHSGGASSSTGGWQSAQYGARADGSWDDRETWGDQSWRGGGWSSSAQQRFHQHDVRHFEAPQHREAWRHDDAQGSWQATQRNWDDRVSPEWKRKYAEWGQKNAVWRHMQ